MTSQLSIDIQYLPGVGPRRMEMLKKELGICSCGDLILHFPYKYIDRSHIYRIREVTGDMPYVQIKGMILSYETFDMGGTRKRVVAHFTDGEHIMDLTWFNGGKYAMQHYKARTPYIVFGKPTVFNGRINIVHPEIDQVGEECEGGIMQPYYPTTEKMKKSGMTSRAIERIMRTLMSKLTDDIPETIPDSILSRHHLMSRNEALRQIHFPTNAKSLEQARLRLKFEELFFVQLNIVRYAADQRRKYKGYMFGHIGDKFNTFYHDYLPFSLTGAQQRVLREIRKDVGSGRQMNRLLQGDVGSGKTLVALMSMLMATDNGYQALPLIIQFLERLDDGIHI